MNKQRGFTLIELVVVIIILGVLAAVAVPKFTDLSVDAHNAAAKGVAGAISSGSSINYAARQAGAASAVIVNQANVCNTALLSQFVDGVRLQNGATVIDDQTFRVSTSTTAGTSPSCAAALGNTKATCAVTPRGTGVAPQDAVVFCAR